MSYARFGPDSDVYVYRNTDGEYVCCGCCIPGDILTVAAFDTPLEMWVHLRTHEEIGHTVPSYAIERLEAEI